MEDKYLMDQHKLLWHLDRVNRWAEGYRIAPLHIDLGITTGCNMACTYCYGVIQGRTGTSNRFDMPARALLRLLKDAKDAGVRSISLVGEGENTLNSALYDGLDFAKKIKMDIALATNGLILEKDRIGKAMSALTWLRFNISAATPGSYLKIHRVKGLETVMDNIRLCVNAKKKNRLKTAIGMQMVLLRDNVKDIVPLARLGKELGVDYLVIKPCSDDPVKTLNSPTSEYLGMKDLLLEAQALGGSTYDVIVKWRKIMNLGVKDFKVCHGTSFVIGISGDGGVFPCGHFFKVRRDEFMMGNVIETPFRKIVKSDKYWKVQKKIMSLDVNKECETNCRQYYCNAFLWRLKNPPAHVNFV